MDGHTMPYPQIVFVDAAIERRLVDAGLSAADAIEFYVYWGA